MCSKDSLDPPDNLKKSQRLMEVLVSPLDNRNKSFFRDQQGKYLVVNTWPGVSLNDKSEVVAINWNNFFKKTCTGFIFELLPPSIEVFVASDCSLSGSLLFEHLPKGLKRLDLSGNHISGKLDFDQLPQGLEHLHLHKCTFSGKPNFHHLPHSLKSFDVSSSGLQSPSSNSMENLPKHWLWLSEHEFISYPTPISAKHHLNDEETAKIVQGMNQTNFPEKK